MGSILRRIAQRIGIDKAIAYTSGARIVQGVSGVGTMFFLSTFLTGVEQGFYFTFGSILALQVFFELFWRLFHHRVRDVLRKLPGGLQGLAHDVRVLALRRKRHAHGRAYRQAHAHALQK